jgi:hypothetical protein
MAETTGTGANGKEKESHDVQQPELDPVEVLEQLRAEHRALVWEPLPPDKMRRNTDTSQVRNRASLEYLHHHWALPDSFDPSEAGSGLRGRVLGLFAKLTYRVLGTYLREERELLSHVVRVNEALEQRCDHLVLRCEQLNQDLVDRQADEAENQAKLALWLSLAFPDAVSAERRPDDPSGSGTAPTGGAGNGSTGGDATVGR